MSRNADSVLARLQDGDGRDEEQVGEYQGRLEHRLEHVQNRERAIADELVL